MFDEILSQELVDEIETSLVEDLKRNPAVVCGVVGHVPSFMEGRARCATRGELARSSGSVSPARGRASGRTR